MATMCAALNRRKEHKEYRPRNTLIAIIAAAARRRHYILYCGVAAAIRPVAADEAPVIRASVITDIYHNAVNNLDKCLA